MIRITAALVLLLGTAAILPAQTVSADEFEKLVKDKKVFLLDVREPKELTEEGAIEGYHLIPISQLESRLNEVPKDKTIVTLCRRGGRANRAAELLRSKGYKVAASCGITQWKESGKKVTYPKEDEIKK